jgi:hypothetical protein
VAGPPPSALAPLIGVSDSEERLLVLASIYGADLSYRLETRGSGLGLEPLRIPLRGALARIEPGEPFALEMRRDGSRLCVSAHAPRGEDRHCQTPWSLAGGWRAFAPFALGARASRAMDALWVALLLVPVGLWARRGFLSALAAALLVAAALAVPTLLGLAPLGLPGLAGAAAGLSLGRGLRGRATPRDA